MPEHVHLLTSEPVRNTLATFLQIFKQLTARELKSPDQRQFWQRRYYDFNVSSHEKYVEKIRYIHSNPVERGLVAKAEDYRWSSFNHYATGEPGAVEIESGWTASRRGCVLPTLRKSAKDGAPDLF
jgi:putative transposase